MPELSRPSISRCVLSLPAKLNSVLLLPTILLTVILFSASLASPQNSFSQELAVDPAPDQDAAEQYSPDQDAPDKEVLVQLLLDFLEGASVGDAAMHDRFWADDLIYTSSSGERYGKAEIMAGFQEQADEGNGVADDPSDEPEPPSVTWSAEEIQVQQYGDVAIIAFRLVGIEEAESQPGDANIVETEEEPVRTEFLNSGTFLKRDGEWRVVNWQATRVPEEENRG